MLLSHAEKPAGSSEVVVGGGLGQQQGDVLWEIPGNLLGPDKWTPTQKQGPLVISKLTGSSDQTLLDLLVWGIGQVFWYIKAGQEERRFPVHFQGSDSGCWKSCCGFVGSQCSILNHKCFLQEQLTTGQLDSSKQKANEQGRERQRWHKKKESCEVHRETGGRKCYSCTLH